MPLIRKQKGFGAYTRINNIGVYHDLASHAGILLICEGLNLRNLKFFVPAAVVDQVIY